MPEQKVDVVRAIEREDTPIDAAVVLESPVEFDIGDNHGFEAIAFGFSTTCSETWAIFNDPMQAIEYGSSPIQLIESQDVFPERYIAEDEDPVWIDLSS